MTFFSGKTILIISPEPWHHLFVSKHHYAIELAKSNYVYFLNPPGRRFEVKKTRYENLWEVNYTSFPSGLRFFAGWLQRIFKKGKFNTIQKRIGVSFDCVWSFDNSVFFDFSFLPENVLRICHVMDYGQNFQLKKAAQSAHVCFGVSQPIVDMLHAHNPNSFLVPHGIPTEFAMENVKLPGENRLKAIFAGNLDRKHFDRNLLLKLAELNPQVDFIFYGSGGADWERKQNTFYPGVVASENLLNHLEKADVLLLPYKFNEFPNELTNSHKVLDYLRSGKVIVSSYLEDYATKEHLLKMARSSDEFVQIFSDVIGNIESNNSSQLKQVRRQFANANSYTTRLREIEEIIGKLTSHNP